jgi:hypothetical protein
MHILLLDASLTPHGGILLSASVAASGAAFAVKMKALANSAIATARCQNMTEYGEGGLGT